MNHISDSQLNEYLDHALTDNLRRGVDSHLESCDGCRARLVELQLVFDSLAALPERKLAHDLAPEILSRLPQKQANRWIPVFAAQVLAMLGMFVFISSRAADFIKLPTLPSFDLIQFTSSAFDRLFPAVNIRSLTVNFLLTIPKFQFLTYALRIPSYKLMLPQLPFSIDQLPIGLLPFSNFPMAVAGITALLLWLFINAVLLRSSSEVKK